MMAQAERAALRAGVGAPAAPHLESYNNAFLRVLADIVNGQLPIEVRPPRTSYAFFPRPAIACSSHLCPQFFPLLEARIEHAFLSLLSLHMFLSLLPLHVFFSLISLHCSTSWLHPCPMLAAQEELKVAGAGPGGVDPSTSIVIRYRLSNATLEGAPSRPDRGSAEGGAPPLPPSEARAELLSYSCGLRADATLEVWERRQPLPPLKPGRGDKARRGRQKRQGRQGQGNPARSCKRGLSEPSPGREGDANGNGEAWSDSDAAESDAGAAQSRGKGKEGGMEEDEEEEEGAHRETCPAPDGGGEGVRERLVSQDIKESIRLGRVPVMVHSALCTLRIADPGGDRGARENGAPMDRRGLPQGGAEELGGYFIVNGNEKVRAACLRGEREGESCVPACAAGTPPRCLRA